ncbi:MAG: hypothetical protein WDN49_04815 [Acetobacteraceae bacterium]
MEPGFRILPSTGGPEAVLLPDQSVCDSCLAELADPTARRHRYPFITCIAMRPALHDYGGHAVRPRQNGHGGISTLCPMPGRI